MSKPFETGEQPLTLTVSELNRRARSLLESHFDFIWIEGEISNFAAPSSGHWYFSLKDDNAQVRCAMFRGKNQRLRFRPGNGDAVRLRCRVSLYEGRGEFQLIAEFMEPAGVGALQAAFEDLKRKLQAEGLFDAEAKQALPRFVRKLGVVTSPTGAAIHDILNVLSRRAPGIEVSILPVPVQGEGSAEQIADAITRANRWNAEGKVALDLLIVGRGGGSIEDLWAFNEEIVARAISSSDLPVISAVGHEVDITISDLVADLRAPTPSAAAELISRDQRELLERLAESRRRLLQLTRAQLHFLQNELGHLRRRLAHPGHRLQEQSQRLDDMEQRMLRAISAATTARAQGLSLLQARLDARSPRQQLTQGRRDLASLEQRLAAAGRAPVQRLQDRLAGLSQLLDSVSPLRTLDRGYSLLTDSEGVVVKHADQVQPGDRVRARLAEGALELDVREISTSPEDAY